MFKKLLFMSQLIVVMFTILSCSVSNNNIVTALPTSTTDIQKEIASVFNVDDLNFKLSYFERTENTHDVWIYDHKTLENRFVFTFNHDEAIPFNQIVWSEDGNKMLIPSFGSNGNQIFTINLVDLNVSTTLVDLNNLGLFESGEFFKEMKIIDWSKNESFVALEVQKGFVKDESRNDFIVLIVDLSDGTLHNLGQDTIFLQWSNKKPNRFASLHRPKRQDQGLGDLIIIEDLVFMVKDFTNDETIFESQILENLSIQGPRPFSVWDEENNIVIFDIYSINTNDGNISRVDDGLMFFDINSVENSGSFLSLPYQPNSWNHNSSWISFERGKFVDGNNLEPVDIKYQDDIPRSLGWVNHTDKFLILENNISIVVVDPNDPAFRNEVEELSLQGVSEFTQFFSWVK